jgi:hypothetical protein
VLCDKQQRVITVSVIGVQRLLLVGASSAHSTA